MPEIDRRLVRSKYVCENDMMHLTCRPSSEVLQIAGADFGESSLSICIKGEVSSPRCKLLEVTDILKTRCDNKEICSIAAMNNNFGNPCEGMNVSAKQRSSSVYLNVMYACVKAVNGGQSTTRKTTLTQPTTFISTNGNDAINATNTTEPPMNSTATADDTRTLPLTTAKPNIKIAAKLDKEIPVFDPSMPVYLGTLSGSKRVTSFSSLSFLTWITVFGLTKCFC
ncbi:Latrophilin Cirl [Stylophora pistillata]|uniref:Latrophilin Cirl n=1 Tax=Stylophora pistillata TaxID=50429 RepID=A0A2B4SEP1_STYPI|nr:Latrophilin Cirl [Stylophora pistillata]